MILELQIWFNERFNNAVHGLLDNKTFQNRVERLIVVILETEGLAERFVHAGLKRDTIIEIVWNMIEAPPTQPVNEAVVVPTGSSVSA